MIQAFVDEIFPTDIAYESSGGPEFNTDVVQFASGEQRNANWAYPRQSWNVAVGIRSVEAMNTLIAFHMARRGMLVGFRFYVHDDHDAENQLIGTGDGSETEFQLVKSYGITDALGLPILKPVLGTVAIRVDGVLKSSPADYSLNYSTGLVTFTAPPASSKPITADFDFHVPVRFATDRIARNLDSYQLRTTTVDLVEIR